MGNLRYIIKSRNPASRNLKMFSAIGIQKPPELTGKCEIGHSISCDKLKISETEIIDNEF